MITGILLIGLGFALGYRKIQKMGTAVQNLTRLPVLIEAVGRAVSIETALRAGYVSPCCKVMCLWYMCFCAEVFFLFSHCTPQMEHSLGVNFFFLLM